MTRRSSALLLGLLLATHLLFANEFRAFPNPNAHSRIYLTLALLDHGTFRLDSVIARFGPIQDVATGRDGLYSDKPPGYSLLLLPPAALLRACGVARDDLRGMAIGLRLLCVSLPIVLFWFTTRGAWGRTAGDPARGSAVVIAAALASPLFVYSTQLFSHAAAGILLWLAARCAEKWRDARGAAACGALLALAFTIDYIVAPAVAVIALWATATQTTSRFRGTAVLLGAALPFAIAWGAYNQHCFGAPLRLGYHGTTDPVYSARVAAGIYGLAWPDIAALPRMFLTPPHGLAYAAPALLLAPLGWWRGWRDPAKRGRAVRDAAMIGASALFIATLVDWRGGWTVSTRYLVPLLPFLFEWSAESLRPRGATRARRFFAAATVVGLLHTALAAPTFPDFPHEFAAPYVELCVPLLRAGCLNGSTFAAISAPVATGLFFLLTVVAAAVVHHAMRDRATTVARDALTTLAISTVLLAPELALVRPNDYARRLRIGDVMTKMGHTCESDAARADLHSQTLTRDAGNSFEITQLGWIRAASPCDSLRDPVAALALAERAVALRPSDPEAWDLRGAALAAASRFDAAIADVERAQALSSAEINAVRRGQMDERRRAYVAGRAWRFPPAPR